MEMHHGESHGHASAGAIGRYHELRARLRCLYQAERRDTAAIDAVRAELEDTHRYFKQVACRGGAAIAPTH